MVEFVLGAAASGRQTRLLEKMRQAKASRRILVVPEQHSFASEREMQRRFGGSAVEVYSFTRLAHQIFKVCGGLAGEYATGVSKLLVMDLAVHEVADRLDLYRASVDKPGFAEVLLKTADELKNSGYTPDDFAGKTADLPDGELRRKVSEFADIFAVYNARLLERYRDPLDDLERAAKAAAENEFFADAAVYFDGFLSFGGAQLQLIRTVLEQGDAVFSICCEPGDSLFEPSAGTVRQLIQMAAQCGVRAAKPELLPPDGSLPAPLRALERAALRTADPPPADPQGRIRVLVAPTEYGEIDAVLAQVQRLAAGGMRYSEMLLLTRDLDTYRSVLAGALRRYDIPYFMDETVCAEYIPLFRCCAALLECGYRFRMETALELLKSGAVGFSTEQVSVFENYVYTWEVDGRTVRKPFSHHPRGFAGDGRETERDAALRETAEQVRMRLLEAVDAVRAGGETGREQAQALLKALDLLGVQQKLIDRIVTLSNQPEQAAQANREWELLVQLLELLVSACGEEAIPHERFAGLFTTAMRGMDIGQLPQALDTLIIGTADRTLPGCPRAVFVFGAVDGTFPYSPNFSGVFTNSDRVVMADCGIRLSKPIEERVEEERLLAYQALCSPSEFLCVSARVGDIAGNPAQPSEVVDGLVKQFGRDILINTDEQSIIDLCYNQESAFMQLALHYQEQDGRVEALRELFAGLPAYAGRLREMERMAESRKMRLNSPAVCRRLFSLRLSPSQIELFYNCPFAYFCRYGLSVQPVPAARLDAPSLGSIVHDVLEHVVALENFANLSESRLKTAIEAELQAYLESRLGGAADKSARFMQMFRRTGRTLSVLCQNIQREFVQSRFRPAAFELALGENAGIPALQLQAEGFNATVAGKIDRVDTCVIDGKTYLRIIDYKTGEKKFSFADLVEGLNLQMLLYLFAIVQNGQEKFDQAVPAGILYLPASGCLKNFAFSERELEPEQLEREIQKGFCANGVLLADPKSLEAMEPVSAGEEGSHIPLKLLKSGEPSKSSMQLLVSPLEMETLFRFVQRQVRRMCESLLAGQIGADPIVGDSKHSACRWCDYAGVCGHNPAEGRTLEKLDKEGFFARADRALKEEKEC